MRATKRPPKQPRQRTLFAVPITWPANPRRVRNELLGRCQRWSSKCGYYRVDRYLDRSGRYLALAWIPTGAGWSWDLLSPHRTLAAAQRACAKHAKRCFFVPSQEEE